MQLKDDFQSNESLDCNVEMMIDYDQQRVFKAIPFNKKIFEESSKLPEVEKKKETRFQEFSLSKSNCKLGKKTL